MSLYIPPDYYESNNPLIFLAGPIQGAPRWQNKAVEILNKANNSIEIASPRYIGEEEEIIGNWAPNITSQQQIDWETYHLKKAGENGVILFWLSKEERHYCERAFAQASRFELGEWKQKHLSNNAKLVVGIDPSFSGRGYIKYRLSKECPDIPIESTLEKTCYSALELLSFGKN